MKPRQFQTFLKTYASQLETVKRSTVVVGLPEGKVGSTIYPSGATVLEIAIYHEFGTVRIPQRSFLRVPFNLKKDKLNGVIALQFQKFLTGADAEQLLDLVGITAMNISKLAFTSLGYGEWPDITDETKKRKGSSQALIESGLLRGQITWEVRIAA